MARTNERRSDPTHIKGDQQTKQGVVFTICGIAWAFTLTSCYLAIRQIEIPPSIKELTLFVLGVISGSLIKTGVDRILPSGTQEAPVKVEQTEVVETKDVSEQ